jgi:NADPH:quinone reductase
MLQRVVRSTIIDAPLARVWSVLRDFNSHEAWHDAVNISAIEGGERSDQIGCIRSFTLKDGNHIREQLLTLSDHSHQSTYCIVEATVPLQRYVATVTLKPVTDGNRTFWRWESTFATPPGLEHELRDLVAQGVYEAGFDNLRRHLMQGGDLNEGSASAGAWPVALAVPARRAVLKQYGGPDVLQPDDGEAPAPAAGEVRIRQRAIGVNFFDVYLRRGWMPALLPLPGVPGMEAAGIVMDVGEGVHEFYPGDRVAYMGPLPGAYCSVRTVPAGWLVRLPPAIDDEVAAATLLKGITADLLVHDLGRVRAGTRVLVHAAAGGVGLLVCSLARKLGATVIGTVSTDEKARLAREFGCQHTLVNRNYRFADAVQKQFGGADVIIDGLGDAARAENFSALARCGHWISVGQATGGLQPIASDLLVQKSATFSRPVVFDYVATPVALAQRAQRVWASLEDGSLRRPPIERHSLDAAARAHERLESRGTAGALVLVA